MVLLEIMGSVACIGGVYVFTRQDHRVAPQNHPEQDVKKLPSLVERLHQLLADEIANLTALIGSGIGP